MRLSAIYLPKGNLPHVFGENHEGQTINLGGEFFYTITQNDNQVYIEKSKETNTSFIPDFWGKNISLVSAIVGANGTGKTSILRILVRERAPKPKPRSCILVYEEEDTIHLLNETDLSLAKSDDFQIIEKDLNEKFLYYSPNLDYDLVGDQYEISLVSYHTGSLSSYYLGNIKRHLLLLKNNEIIDVLRGCYEDFPFYEDFIFRAKPLSKGRFEEAYIRITGGRTIQDALKELWKTYPNENQDRQPYINGGIDFIKDIEVNILSYLALDDTFALKGDYGAYPFSKILQAESFEDKLTHFLRKYIIQTSQEIYTALTQDINNISVTNFDKLKSEVQKSSGTKAKKVIERIELIESVHTFYSKLVSLMRKEYCKELEGGFEVDIVNANIQEFNDLIDCYEKMLSQLRWGYLGGVLEIRSNIKLSTGEKAILDMYASIYDYLGRFREHQYAENIILLLDEPEQGYHPLWKKKFIQALTATLPKLFEVNPVIKNLQIIFTTHDTLTLSDIPKSNIVYLEKDKNGIASLAFKEAKKSFGANINDLLADSFFIEGSLMGDFVEGKIKETIQWINKVKKHPNDIPIDKLKYYEKVISLIEEPVIRIKLAEMLDEVKGKSSSFQKEMIEKEIRHLQKKADNL